MSLANVKLVSEIVCGQIVGDSETASAINPGSHLKDPYAIAIEGRQQRLFATRGPGSELLQGRCGDEKRRLHRLIVPPKVHRVARAVVETRGVGKSDSHC